MHDYIVEIETEVGTTVSENLIMSEPLIEVDVDTSGNLVDVWESDLSSVEVLMEGPQGPGYAILDVDEEPPPGTPPGTIFLVRQT